jgi:hypothetical protein
MWATERLYRPDLRAAITGMHYFANARLPIEDLIDAEAGAWGQSHDRGESP